MVKWPSNFTGTTRMVKMANVPSKFPTFWRLYVYISHKLYKEKFVYCKLPPNYIFDLYFSHRHASNIRFSRKQMPYIHKFVHREQLR